MTTKTALKNLSEQELNADTKAFQYCRDNLVESIDASDKPEERHLGLSMGLTEAQYEMVKVKVEKKILEYATTPDVTKIMLSMLTDSKTLAEYTLTIFLYYKLVDMFKERAIKSIEALEKLNKILGDIR